MKEEHAKIINRVYANLIVFAFSGAGAFVALFYSVEYVNKYMGWEYLFIPGFILWLALGCAGIMLLNVAYDIWFPRLTGYNCKVEYIEVFK